MNIFVATTVHIPKALLASVDRKARSLQISRNKLIVRALERELAGGSDWSPHFFERLVDVGPEVARAADEVLDRIREGRRSRARPPAL
jgi:hypothetical protein